MAQDIRILFELSNCSCIGFDTVVPFFLDQLLLAVVQTLQTQLKSILSRLLRLNCFSLTENQTVCTSLFGYSYFNSAPKFYSKAGLHIIELTVFYKKKINQLSINVKKLKLCPDLIF